jgi:hypothetical protein
MRAGEQTEIEFQLEPGQGHDGAQRNLLWALEISGIRWNPGTYKVTIEKLTQD